MTSGADVWICRHCRSINPIRSGSCYRCHTPIEVAAAKPADLSATAAPIDTAIPATGEFRSSEMRAVALTIAVVVLVLNAVLAAWVAFSLADLRVSGDSDAAARLLQERGLVLTLVPVMTAIALVAYAFWIRRVVENLPTLGLGYSKVSPTWAFFEPMIPFVNFYGIPARMGEAITKLGPHPTAMPLLGLAVVLVVIPGIALVWVLRVVRVLSLSALTQVGGIPLAIGLVAECLALVVGLVVVWQIEGLQRAANEKLQAGAPSAAAVATAGTR